MSLVKIDPELGNKRIGSGKLCQSKDGDRELTDAYDTNPKLGKSKNATGKLADGNDASGWNRNPVGPVLEGNM